MSIVISFQGTDELVLTAIGAKAAELGPAVVAKLDQLDTDVQAYIVSQELAGQVLRQRSGKLAGSIRVIPAALEGESVTGQVQGAGGPAWYGVIHEEGGTFEVQRRRVALGSKKQRSVLAKQASKYGEDYVTHVESKPYTIHFPKRAFMAPGLEHMTSAIVSGIEQTIGEVLAK